MEETTAILILRLVAIYEAFAAIVTLNRRA
jgi:hypothetical protein